MTAPVWAGCDCHVHIFDPQRFAYGLPRRFTPGPATVKQLQLNLKLLGLTHAVLVQPSVYGDDNACLLDALRTMGDTVRGVTVVSARTTQRDIEQMDKAGVRGARLNLAVDHFESAARALNKLRELEDIIPAAWHVQLHVSPQIFSALAASIERSNRCYVLDHFGLPDVLAVSADPGNAIWAQQLDMMQTGRLYVKLSAPYLISRKEAPYDDLTPLVANLLKTRPDRILWGSNWPHTQGTARSPHADTDAIESFRTVDDLAWLSACQQLTGCAGPKDSVADSWIADNARRLYGFTRANLS